MSVSPTLPAFPSQRRASAPSTGWTVPRERILTKPVAPRPAAIPRANVTRRFEIEWLEENGNTNSDIVVAPAFPVFEQAFGAFSHGVLIQTTEGPVAVEDLYPGMYLECGNGRTTQLLWKGAITIVPGAPTLNEEPDKLYRVSTDAFGLGRPVQDQTFGPHARRVDRDPKFRATMGTDAALVPLSAVVDGHSVIEVTPVSPTRVYHLACESHEAIRAAGLDVETYHPGPETPLSLSEEMMQVFMRFFPYAESVRSFGTLNMPRVTQDELYAFTE